MTVWAIGDLHLSLGMAPEMAKPMDVFGLEWTDHAETIARNWREKVRENDIVLIPGDICWANKLDDVDPTFKWMEQLPGRKILLRGNHDNWWQSINKLRDALPPDVYAIHNDAVLIDGIAFCGTRGWSYVDEEGIEHQEKMLNRERLRLEASLACLPEEANLRIALMHFPPFPAPCHDSEFVQLLLAHDIDICVFGHLHGQEASKFQECTINKTKFVLVSADYLDFSPEKIYNVVMER